MPYGTAIPKINDTHWTTEVAIPFSQLRFSRSDLDGLGREFWTNHPAKKRGGNMGSRIETVWQSIEISNR